MNKILAIGRLAKDADVRYSQSDAALAIARYVLAVDRKIKKDGEPTADFLNCIAFGKAAEFAEKYLKKGMKIAIEGRLQTGSYTNKEGQKVYTTDVVIESQEFVEKKGNDEPKAEAKTDADGFMQIPDGVNDEGLPW